MANKQKTNDNRQYLDGDLTHVKSIDDNGTFEGIVATNDVDRHGETINIMGIDTSTYMSTNPIVLFGHDYWEAESVIGKALSLTKTKGGQLLSTFKLFVDDNPKALLVSKLIKNGVCSLSIGFVPKEINGDDYTKSEMVEYSVVPVPANGAAAITARSLGLTKKDMGAIKKAFANSDAINITDDTVEVKGAVADEIAAEEVWEQKWANMREVWDIMYAFTDVYYDEETPVEDFGKLLAETASLLTALTGGATVEEEPMEDSADDEIVEYSVSEALKKLDVDKVKAFVAAHKDIRDGKTVKSMDDNDMSTWTTFAMTVKKLADDTIELRDKMTEELSNVGAGSLKEQEIEGSGTDTPLEASNTVKEVATVTPETADEDVEEDIQTEVAQNDAKKQDNEIVKSVDKPAQVDNNLNQLVAILKEATVALEEKAAKANSQETTDGDSHSIVRKRKVVLRETKHAARKVDQVVEMVLSELKHTK